MLRTNTRGHTYPEALAALDHFYDSSYGNDVTDSVCFAVGGKPFTVWIEHEDPSERSEEFGPDKVPSRFTVMALEDGDPEGKYRERPATLLDLVEERHIESGHIFFETDDPAALVAILPKLANAIQCPHCMQWRTLDTDECGGEGEGICEAYADAIEADPTIERHELTITITTPKMTLRAAERLLSAIEAQCEDADGAKLVVAFGGKPL